ncbi:RING-H2 finger protein ATL39-like [Telopea speciosissima]|uniref:RING-H2 finger protein ATL39-like n=1 Tax=Telopea speciosissima TaxID=54955 RepID=UPI001CC5BAFD|nr:RING-H2 finger protein ATL39-like [Telopea speciosissima]
MASDEDSGYYLLDVDDDVWYRSVGKFIALVLMVVVVMLIYFYAWRTCRRHRREASQPSINVVSTASQVVQHSLHLSVIASLPTFVYNPPHQLQNSTDTVVECAVCLSKLEEGDMARLIPTCKHIFHLQCINMWLSSHSTCPLCRSAAQASTTAQPHHEPSSMGPQLDSFSPSTPSNLESTSHDASSQTSKEDA